MLGECLRGGGNPRVRHVVSLQVARQQLFAQQRSFRGTRLKFDPSGAQQYIDNGHGVLDRIGIDEHARARHQTHESNDDHWQQEGLLLPSAQRARAWSSQVRATLCCG